MRAAALVAVGVGLAAGCGPDANGDDPLVALSVAKISERYNAVYWRQQQLAQPELWQKAVGFCAGQDTGKYPNCQPVVELHNVDETVRRTRNAPRPQYQYYDGMPDVRSSADSTPRRPRS